MKTETETTTVDELEAATAKIAGIHQKMKYLVTLTPEQRQERRGMRVGTRKLHLLQNRVAAAAANPGLLPARFNLPELERDTAISVALFDMLTVLGKVWDSVSDTLTVVGGPAVLNAATANSHIKLASASAHRLTPTERATKGRFSVKPTQSTPSPVPVEPAQPEEVTELPPEPTSQAA